MRLVGIKSLLCQTANANPQQIKEDWILRHAQNGLKGSWQCDWWFLSIYETRTVYTTFGRDVPVISAKVRPSTGGWKLRDAKSKTLKKNPESVGHCRWHGNSEEKSQTAARLSAVLVLAVAVLALKVYHALRRVHSPHSNYGPCPQLVWTRPLFYTSFCLALLYFAFLQTVCI